MRTPTASETRVIGLPTRRTSLRLYVYVGATPYNLCSLENYDWVKSISYSEDVDSPAVRMQVELFRSVEDLSLATLMDGSKINASGTLIDVNHRVLLQVATTPEDTIPVGGDYMTVFDGYIETVDWSGPVIKLDCLDKGGQLQGIFIETQQVYGAVAGKDVEEVIQDILDDHVNTPVLLPYTVTLYSANGTGATPFAPADSPGWAIKEYYQSKDTVLSACRKLAAMIGWDCKYRWNTDTSAFQLTLFEPDRAKVVADATFDHDDYFEISALSVSRQNVRNVVKVTYEDSVSGRTTTTKTNAASITKYGRRYMEVTEDASSQIDTSTEADAMADAILADLKEPVAEHQAAQTYYPWAQIGDLYTYTANGVHYDTDQTLALVSIQHSLTRESCRSTFQCRGTPSGGWRRWLELQGRPGVAPPVDLKTDDAPTATASAALGTIIVTYDDPRSMSPPMDDWAFTKCHVDTSSGFTPGSGNLKAIGRQTRFEVNGLVPGTTYYVKLVLVDEQANESTISTQVSEATQTVGPYHANNNTEFGTMNPNPSFAIYTFDKTSNPPDFWLPDASISSTWGSADGKWYYSDTTMVSGDLALQYNGEAKPGAGTQTRAFLSKSFVVEASTLYAVEFAWQHDGDDGNKTWWDINVRWYDKDDAYISEDNLVETIYTYSPTSGLTVAASTWIQDRGWVKAPSTARYARIKIYLEIPSGMAGPQTKHPAVVWDHISFSRALVELAVEGGGGPDRSIAANAVVQPWLSSSATLDNASNFTSGSSVAPNEHAYDIEWTGQYIVTGEIYFAAPGLAAGQSARCMIVVNGATYYNGQPITFNSGAWGPSNCWVTTGIIQLNAGDAIVVAAIHDDPAGQTLDDSECKLRVAQFSTRGSR